MNFNSAAQHGAPTFLVNESSAIVIMSNKIDKDESYKVIKVQCKAKESLLFFF